MNDNRLFVVDLSYTVKSADHRIQYQSFEVPLERDSTIRRDLPPNYSVLHATHKHFIPPSFQQCQIPLEEDVLIEIFVTKAKRTKPVSQKDFSLKKNRINSFRRNCVISGSIHSFLSNRKCK